jgi:hypothetical protein
MSGWVLIMVMYTSLGSDADIAITTEPFETQELCEAAADVTKKLYPKIKHVCMPQGKKSWSTSLEANS